MSLQTGLTVEREAVYLHASRDLQPRQSILAKLKSLLLCCHICTGPDLRKLAADGRISQNINFVQYATGMLTALQHVHKHGIVHKDVKPANFCLGATDTCYSDKVAL